MIEDLIYKVTKHGKRYIGDAVVLCECPECSFKVECDKPDLTNTLFITCHHCKCEYTATLKPEAIVSDESTGDLECLRL